MSVSRGEEKEREKICFIIKILTMINEAKMRRKKEENMKASEQMTKKMKRDT
jgi:hypothetical protein